MGATAWRTRLSGVPHSLPRLARRGQAAQWPFSHLFLFVWLGAWLGSGVRWWRNPPPLWACLYFFCAGQGSFCRCLLARDLRTRLCEARLEKSRLLVAPSSINTPGWEPRWRTMAADGARLSRSPCRHAAPPRRGLLRLRGDQTAEACRSRHQFRPVGPWAAPAARAQPRCSSHKKVGDVRK